MSAGWEQSTFGMALIAAYWLLVVLFILLALVFSVLVTARAKMSHRGFAGVCLLPAIGGVGAATQLHPGWSLVMTGAAILFSLWWLHNMDRRAG